MLSVLGEGCVHLPNAIAALVFMHPRLSRALTTAAALAAKISLTEAAAASASASDAVTSTLAGDNAGAREAALSVVGGGSATAAEWGGNSLSDGRDVTVCCAAGRVLRMLHGTPIGVAAAAAVALGR